MGQMRFYTPMPEKLAAQAVERAYLAGMEAIPWCSRNSWNDGCLSLERASSESGCLYIPWSIDGSPSRMLTTCNLMDRERPYCLPIEVARGTLHRARSLVVDLEGGALEIPEEVQSSLKRALAGFLRASTARVCSDEPAVQVIQEASSSIEALMRIAWRDTLTWQCDGESRLETWLSGRLDNWPVPEQHSDEFLRAFDSVCIPFRWRDIEPEPGQFNWQKCEQQVEWCRQHGLTIIGGPVLQLDETNLPDWVTAQDKDYQSFERAALSFVERVTKRFDRYVSLWFCAGRLNIRSLPSFCEEQKLRLAVTSIEAVRRTVPDKPVLISFDQPWAEYLVTEDFDLSPLHFADALVRADLGLSGVGLEINFNYWPGGTLPRDLLEVANHIDRWSQLGIPLMLQVTLPSSAEPDPLAYRSADVFSHSQNHDSNTTCFQEEMDDLLPLLCTRSAVHGVVWGQLSDQFPHEFPRAGVFDSSGRPKALLGRLATFRETYLRREA